MIVKKGTTDVNVYFKIQAGLTATDFDTQYTRSGSAASTKVDVTALGSAGASHTDNAGIYVDATTSPGLFRLCVPDAAFATGVDEVEVTLLYASGLQETVRVTLVDNITKDVYDRIGAPVGASISADIAGVQSDTDNIQTRIPTSLVSGRMDSSVGAMASNTLTASALATDAVTEIQSGLATTVHVQEVEDKIDIIDGNIDTLITRIPDVISLANINGEVVDVLFVDVVAELVAITPASTTIAKMLQLLHMTLRNKRTTSHTQDKIHNDAGTVIATAPVSSTVSLFTKDEFA